MPLSRYDLFLMTLLSLIPSPYGKQDDAKAIGTMQRQPMHSRRPCALTCDLSLLPCHRVLPDGARQPKPLTGRRLKLAPNWPDFGRTAVLNADPHRTTSNSVPAGGAVGSLIGELDV